MKKFMLVLSTVLLLSATTADARGFNNHRHQPQRGNHQQVVVVNNYNQARHGFHNRRPAQNYHHNTYYSNRHYKHNKRSNDVAAVALGVVGVAAIVSALSY